jgi:hypothetical protein
MQTCLYSIIPQVVLDVIAEVVGGDCLMQRLQAAMEATLAQHGAHSVQAVMVLDVSWPRCPATRWLAGCLAGCSLACFDLRKAVLRVLGLIFRFLRWCRGRSWHTLLFSLRSDHKSPSPAVRPVCKWCPS